MANFTPACLSAEFGDFKQILKVTVEIEDVLFILSFMAVIMHALINIRAKIFTIFQLSAPSARRVNVSKSFGLL